MQWAAGSPVSWSIATTNYSADYIQFGSFITSTAAASIIQAAFNAWEAVANIDFVRTSDSSSVDIRLGYYYGDGPSGTLAVANYSYSSGLLREAFISFDSRENWNLSTTGNFYLTALHEIGHTLGLGHSTVSPSIMSAFLNSSLSGLTADDIAGIQAIYGAPSNGGGGDPPPPPSPPSSNKSPTAIGLSASNVSENASGGTIVGQLTASDPDAGDSHTYKLLSGNGLFSIQGSTLRVAQGARLDYESQASHVVRIQATDEGGLNITRNFTINLANVAISDLVVKSGGSIVENARPGQLVAIFEALEGVTPESNADLELVDDAGGLFELVGSELRVAAGARIDFEEQASHSIKVRASDGTGPAYEETITITVGNAPITQIAVSGATVEENASAGTVVALLEALEGETTEASATFTLLDGAEGRFVIVGNEVHVADGAIIDFEASSGHEIVVLVSDGSQDYSQQIEIAVLDMPGESVVGTQFDDRLEGTSEDDKIYGLAGNDIFRGSEGSDLIDGGAGMDSVVYGEARALVMPSLQPNGTVLVTKENGAVDHLFSIERIELADGAYLYDLATEDPAFVYRIYQAAFGRVPDEGGLRFWVDIFNHLDGWMTGEQKQTHISTQFVNSAEFRSLYGANPTDAEYVDAMYGNVLGRLPDDQGRSFWVDAMENGLSPEATLILFAESDENVKLTMPNLDDGLWVV